MKDLTSKEYLTYANIANGVREMLTDIIRSQKEFRKNTAKRLKNIEEAACEIKEESGSDFGSRLNKLLKTEVAEVYSEQQATLEECAETVKECNELILQYVPTHLQSLYLIDINQLIQEINEEP